jgi:ParB/RepB/Spo0J family partition protein
MPEPTVNQPTAPQLIPLFSLRESAFNARKTFPDGPLKELAASIKQHGIQQPIKVRPAADGLFEIVFGSRRFRAAKIAELGHLPAFVETLSDDDAMEINLIENIQREGVDAIEQAEGFRRLLDLAPVEGKKKHTVESIATVVGMSANWVYQQLQLLKLDPAVKEKVQAGTLSMSHGSVLTRVPAPIQKEALREMALVSGDGGDAPSVKWLEDWIGRNAYKDIRAAIFDRTDATLIPAAGACIKCPKFSAVDSALAKACGNTHTCTDRVCFDKKHWAEIFRRRNALIAKQARQQVTEKTGYPVVLISTRHDKPPVHLPEKVKILDRNEWWEVAKPCANLRLGFVVWAYDQEDLCQVKTVCVDGKCPVHRAGVAPPTAATKRIAHADAATNRDANREADEEALRVAIMAKKPDEQFILASAAANCVQTVCPKDRAVLEKKYAGLNLYGNYAQQFRWTQKQKPAVLRNVLLDCFLHDEKVLLPDLKEAAKALKLQPDRVITAARQAAALAAEQANVNQAVKQIQALAKPVQTSVKGPAAKKKKPATKATKATKKAPAKKAKGGPR